MATRVLITGGGGFIGHHLGRMLRKKGYWVRGVDYKPMEFGDPDECFDEFWPSCDMRSMFNAVAAVEGMQHIYALAADMGGMGFISTNHWRILSNNAQINTTTAQAAATSGTVTRLLYTSSACVYPISLQTDVKARNLKESDAWQGSPEDAYGVEKLMAEQLYMRMSEVSGITVRIARFHNIYGPEGTYDGGREKLPAACCRKVAEIWRDIASGKLRHADGPFPISVWGDGEQTRSFCYITDCLEMIHRLMYSTYSQPMNIGTDHLISVNEMYDLAARIAGIEIYKVHDLSKPQGVRGRNADLSKMRKALGWEPQVSIGDGMAETYPWIERQVALP